MSKTPTDTSIGRPQNAVAREIKASKGDKQLRAAVHRFNDAGLWTIAKLDLFQDTLLATHRPDWAIQDSVTGKPWHNRQKLAWGNPHDERVWDYNLALARELLALGFDEIQFDYIRFPSDGDLTRVKYPKVLKDKDRLQVIGAFLEKANRELKPLGATISVDLFGFVAWMTYDFGVGQRIEEIAPHVDAICPMLYPSHFPRNFMGKDDPAKCPREIMEESMKRLKKRTRVDVRAWIQGFWYQPGDITEQIKGIEAAGYKSYLVWSPSSRYDETYLALAAHQNKTFALPKYYPTLAELTGKGRSALEGVTQMVNMTDYVKGSTVLCLDRSTPERKSAYTTPRQLVDTFDEAILDAILQARGIESVERAPGAGWTARLAVARRPHLCAMRAECPFPGRRCVSGRGRAASAAGSRPRPRGGCDSGGIRPEAVRRPPDRPPCRMFRPPASFTAIARNPVGGLCKPFKQKR